MPHRIVFRDSENREINTALGMVKDQLNETGTRTFEEILPFFKSAADQASLYFKVDKRGANLHEITFGLSSNPGDCAQVATVNTSPVKTVYYTPFKCMYSQAENLFQLQAGHAVEKSLDSPGSKPLAKYGQHTIFYVVGHGDRHAGALTCDCGNCGEFGMGLIPGSLWTRLKDAGLPDNAREIRLWACLGADRPSLGNPSLAESLVQQMEWDEDYLMQNTTVRSFSGYLTMTRTGGFSYTERNDDTTRVKAHDRMVTVRKPTDVWEPAQGTLPPKKLLLETVRVADTADALSSKLSAAVAAAVDKADGRKDLQVLIVGPREGNKREIRWRDKIAWTESAVAMLNRGDDELELRISRAFFEYRTLEVRIYDRLISGVNF